jgi:hypothetical protein
LAKEAREQLTDAANRALYSTIAPGFVPICELEDDIRIAPGQRIFTWLMDGHERSFARPLD